jgi:hypothetical protein
MFYTVPFIFFPFHFFSSRFLCLPLIIRILVATARMTKKFIFIISVAVATAVAVSTVIALTLRNKTDDGGDNPECSGPTEPDVAPDLEPVADPEDPAVLDPQLVEPIGVIGTVEERGRGLRQSKWADPTFDPVAARRARGLPGTYREEEQGGWL